MFLVKQQRPVLAFYACQERIYNKHLCYVSFIPNWPTISFGTVFEIVHIKA